MPPRRRKRYRYRLRRLTPVGVLVSSPGSAARGSARTRRRRRRLGGGAAAAAPQVVQPRGEAGVAAAPERLLDRRLAARHTFTPRLLASAAVLVDGKTGRVLWAQQCARAAAGRLDDEDHDRAARAAEAAAARHRHGRQVGAACPARARGPAGRRASRRRGSSSTRCCSSPGTTTHSRWRSRRAETSGRSSGRSVWR